jgi:hypothetical protein
MTQYLLMSTWRLSVSVCPPATRKSCTVKTISSFRLLPRGFSVLYFTRTRLLSKYPKGNCGNYTSIVFRACLCGHASCFHCPPFVLNFCLPIFLTSYSQFCDHLIKGADTVFLTAICARHYEQLAKVGNIVNYDLIHRWKDSQFFTLLWFILQPFTMLQTKHLYFSSTLLECKGLNTNTAESLVF